MKAYILQVNKDKFNSRYYSIFDSICSQLSLVNTDVFWILPTNLNIQINTEEMQLLNSLLFNYSTKFTHLQINK